MEFDCLRCLKLIVINGKTMSSRPLAWSLPEATLALSLYAVTPSPKLKANNPQIIALSKIIGRAPGSVKCRLHNFASLDKRATGRGFNHISELDRLVWNKYSDGQDLNLLTLMNDASDIACNHFDKDLDLADWLDISDNSLSSSATPSSPDNCSDLLVGSKLPAESEVEILCKRRRSQGYFRQAVLANFNDTCAISGCRIRGLVEAAHILSWADHPNERLRQSNGLALNPFFHAAFDQNLLGISPDGKVNLSRRLLRDGGNNQTRQSLQSIDGLELDFGSLRVTPNRDYLAERFRIYTQNNL